MCNISLLMFSDTSKPTLTYSFEKNTRSQK